MQRKNRCVGDPYKSSSFNLKILNVQLCSFFRSKLLFKLSDYACHLFVAMNITKSVFLNLISKDLKICKWYHIADSVNI